MKSLVMSTAVLLGSLFASVASAQHYQHPSQCDSCDESPCFSEEACFPDGSCGDDLPFDGLYIGGTLGAFSLNADRNDYDGFLTDNSGWSLIDTGFTGGFQIGHDWRSGNRVFGIVADWNGSDVSAFFEDNPNALPADSSVASDLNWFASIRARAGIVVDDALFYVSAGPAIGDFDTVWRDGADSFTFSDDRWGLTGTVGTEVQISEKLTFGGELYYLQFAEATATFNDGVSDFRFGQSDSGYGIRLMLNYHFGR